MSLLDAHIPQSVASESAFGGKAGLMRSTIGQAEQEAWSAQAFHTGDSAAAFQAAHARFVAAAKVNSLLAQNGSDNYRNRGQSSRVRLIRGRWADFISATA